MSGSEIASEVAAAYAEAGVDAGDGVGAVSITIARPGSPTGDAWNPTPGALVNHVFASLPMSIEEAQKSGMTMAEGERVYTMANHGVAIEPETGDTAVIDGDDWAVTEVMAAAPAGFTVYWMVKVRK